MKIIFSNFDDIKNPVYGGGGAYAVHEVAKRLAKKHKVSVVTGKYPSSKNEVLDDVSYIRTGLSIGSAKLRQLFFHLFLILNVLKRDHDVWIESFTPPFSTSFLPIFSKKPVIGLVHMLSGIDMKRKYRIPFQIIESRGLKYYKNFIVLTEDQKEKIIKINNDAEISVIPNGIQQPESSIRKNTKNILFIGRIELDQKGLDLLLKAYKNINDKETHKLFIAGDGNKKEIKILNGLIESYGLTKHVVFLGKVEGKVKHHLFMSSRLVVIPSRFETLCIVALEALSYGKKVITFDIDGFRWLPKSLISKVKPFDVEELVKSIDKNIEKEISNTHFLKAREFTKSYSWEQITKEYDRYLQRLA